MSARELRELARLRIQMARAEGALADARMVPTDDLERGIRALTAETVRLRALMQQELKVYTYGVSERVRLEKELEQAEARVAALEEALRGAMKKLQRYGEQTEDESAALARPTTAHAPVGTNIVKCPCGRLHARSSGCPCGCATTPTP